MHSKGNAGKWICAAKVLTTTNTGKASSHFDENYDTVIQQKSRKVNRRQAVFLN
jgi:hypothetical protein